MSEAGHIPEVGSWSKHEPNKHRCQCGALYDSYENHMIRVRGKELLDYMENIGYDPIGASDIRSDAYRWLQARADLWVYGAEALYTRFTQTERFKSYGIRA